jgi:transcriptional regulator with XRE-family HTH domain
MKPVNLIEYKIKKHKNLLFRELIALLRHNQGLTQEEVGKRTGCDRSTVSRWETGALPIHPEDATRLAEVYNREDIKDHYCINECPIGCSRKRKGPDGHMKIAYI